MPNAYIINQRPTNYGGALSLLVEMLVSAGWTYQGSGDGTSAFSSSGKIFTGTGAGALGWGNANAWARVQDPAAVREFVFQHDNAGGIKIRYSPLSKFTGVLNGALSQSVAPTATDERYVRGASGAFNAWFNTSTATVAPYGGAVVGANTVVGSVIYQGAAMSAAPYGFWYASQLHDGAKTKGASLLFDPVNSAPEDTDPYVIQCGTTNSFAVNTSNLGRDGNAAATWTTANGTVDGSWAHMDSVKTGTATYSGTTNIISWASHGLQINSTVIFTVSGGTILTGLTAGTTYYISATNFTANQFSVSTSIGGGLTSVTAAGTGTTTGTGQSWFYVQPAGYAANISGNTINMLTSSGVLANLFSSKYEALPVPYVRTAAAAQLPGLKGWSTMCRWTGTVYTSFLDTFDSKNWICVGGFWLPWNGTTQPLS
jgi:hypothetical protein